MPTPYDQIAPFYDAIHGKRNKTIRYIKQLIKTYHPTATTLLDLACGTGSILKALVKKYQLIGLDLSASMLAIAQQKLPHVSFIQADICNFTINQKFDVITCLFASINHLLDFAQWQNTFQQAKRHLNPGGVFIFDIFTDYCLQQLVINSPIIIETRKVKTIGTISLTEQRYTSWDIVGINKKAPSSSPLFKEHILQTTFPLQKILPFLQNQFSSVTTFDPEHLTINPRSELLYFVCRL